MNWTLPGHAGPLAGRTWPRPAPSWLAVLAHDYAERLDRYVDAVSALSAAGAVVVGHDLAGHGDSAGEQGLITDVEALVDDQDAVLDLAVAAHPGLPVVLIGHGLGGTVVVRHTQRHPGRATALVLSAPVLGNWAVLDLLSEPELPHWPTDPAIALDRRTLTAIEHAIGTIDFDHPLGDELPALWLHGTEDELVPMEDTRAGLDRVRGLGFQERIYPGAGHDLWHGPIATEVLADVTAFARTVVSP